MSLIDIGIAPTESHCSAVGGPRVSPRWWRPGTVRSGAGRARERARAPVAVERVDGSLDPDLEAFEVDVLAS